jgi:hypothetical protein
MSRKSTAIPPYPLWVFGPVTGYLYLTPLNSGFETQLGGDSSPSVIITTTNQSPDY